VRDFTLVLGLDAKHLKQLSWVWPTWMKYKPELRTCPLLIFYDCEQVKTHQIKDVIGPREHCTLFAWPPRGVTYAGDPDSKWYHPQRYKMLSGFVHVPAMHCETDYWLKLDTDVIATGVEKWIEKKWFRGMPSIVSHSWGYTKPADQMIRLDRWVQEHPEELSILHREAPLNLIPLPGSDLVKHSRIISWCAFFSTSFTKFAAHWATQTCGEFQLPVPSQDGYLWYCAKRMGNLIATADMKRCGWQQWNTEQNIRKAAMAAMGESDDD
jgi:hypothetical protein